LNIHARWKTEFGKLAVFKNEFISRIWPIQSSKLMEVLKVLAMVFRTIILPAVFMGVKLGRSH
jgi:hypothetical protein